jgi:5,10-methylenetetrahydromethanopterin reductase
MDFGIVTAKVDEIGYITHAENLGFTHCWVTDSQMIRSNCWAVLALAARDTRRMRLGTGVNVPGLRLAPVAANGIATINRLAPGRCFISFGTGHTAMRTLGQRPMRLAPFREYVQVVRALEKQGLKQIMLYPPLNRQYRVIEDFAESVMARL